MVTINCAMAARQADRGEVAGVCSTGVVVGGIGRAHKVRAFASTKQRALAVAGALAHDAEPTLQLHAFRPLRRQHSFAARKIASCAHFQRGCKAPPDQPSVRRTLQENGAPRVGSRHLIDPRGFELTVGSPWRVISVRGRGKARGPGRVSPSACASGPTLHAGLPLAVDAVERGPDKTALVAPRHPACSGMKPGARRHRGSRRARFIAARAGSALEKCLAAGAKS